MDDQTLAALNGSIKKWKGIRYRGREDKGADNCELCAQFRAEDDDECCKGCPVEEVTGEDSCEGSPYSAWGYHQRVDHEGSYYREIHADCEECEQLCDLEIAFLESLLPDNPADQAEDNEKTR